MYLFARRRRIRVGHQRQGVAWSVAMGELVAEISGRPIAVWASSWGPEVGTMIWSTFCDDLAGVHALTDSVMADDRWHEMVATGEAHFDASVDDRISSVVSGTPSEESPAYVVSVRATIASGRFAEGVVKAVAIAEGLRERTGQPTLVTSEITGVYGTVSWLTSSGSIDELDKAAGALAGDPSWLELVSANSGCFVDGAEQLILRRVG
jgi:hypothetical protein